MRQRVIEGRDRKSEGIETNCFNAVFGAWFDVGICPRRYTASSVCGPLQATDLLPSLWRACLSMTVTGNNPA